MMVVEQTGRIMVLRGGRKLSQPFLDLRSKITYGGEQGLLSVAFPPDYQRAGRFYVYYTDRGGGTTGSSSTAAARTRTGRTRPAPASS